MAEEFQESDIIFSNKYVEDGYLSNKENLQRDMNIALSCSDKSSKKKKMARSLPVDIPESGFRISYSDDEIDEGEVVPPHLIVARRGIAAREMAFSVRCGNGRRLKGREMGFVRNSILRLTGFLET